MSNTQPCTLITGATGGLGRHFATCAAKDSLQKIVLVGRDKEALQKVVIENHIEDRAFIIAADLAQTLPAVKKISELLEKNNLWVETLINNAGFGVLGNFDQTDAQKEQEMIAVNIATLTALCKLVAPEMKKQNSGHILNVASVAAFFPGPYMAVYYASKAYVLSFTLALREELSTTNIHITALCPGPTQTGFAKRAEAQKASVFQGNLANAQDMAQFGWRSLKNNTAVALFSWNNVIMIALTRILPLPFLARIIGKVQKPA